MKILLLIICFSPAIFTADVPDETFVLRFRPSLSVIDKELHVGTTSLGKLLHDNNGTIISPLISSPSLPPLSCIGTSQNCAWKSNQSWEITEISSTEDIFIKLPPAASSSGVPNCEWAGTFVCSCPDKFVLSSDAKSCQPSSAGKFYKLLGTNIFGLNSYGNMDYRRWLIVPSEGHTLTLSFNWIDTEANYDFVQVYDNTYNLLYRTSGNTYGKQISSKHAILVQFISDGSGSQRGFEAVVQETPAAVSALQLNNDEGYLSTPIVISPVLCVTTVYEAAFNETIFLYVGSNLTNATQLSETYHKQIGSWHVKRFKKMYTLNETGVTQNLTVKFRDQGNSILSISMCDPSADKDVYKLGFISATYQPDTHKSEYLEKLPESEECYNGGIFSSAYQACICPSGFTGIYCEEGCGPNRFGNDCSWECSAFGDDCKNILFCKTDLTCFCAPGFEGEFCNNLCYENHMAEELNNTSSEFYGANCTNKCGECLHHGCDPITGICNEGCKDGYYPPLCQDTYSRITNAPTVVERSWDFCEVSVNFSMLEGKGTPKFYQVQLQELYSKEWMDMQLDLVPKGSMDTKIGGLKPGTTYKIRIIIINEDGQSYQGELIPLGEFQTICSVPDSNQYYQINVTNITATGFNISYNYEIKNSSVCHVTGFEVSLQYKWQNLSNLLNVAENMKLFTNLLPGTTYYLTVQAITENGRVPVSSKVGITTASQAPGLVRMLKVSPHARELHVTWETPWSTKGNITSYRVFYQCKKILACPFSCENSKGEKDVNGMSAVIDNLIPHAQYIIGVAGTTATLGPYNYIYAVTNQTVPSVAPEASEQPVVSKSNTSITVQWLPPNCSGLNGYPKGYYYELFEVHPTAPTLLQYGSSLATRVSFHGLKPYTNLEVNIHVVNMVGKNMDYKLSIPVSTTASVPEAVRNLTVYKAGRRILGIRWAPPLESFGTLKSFSISYRKEDSITEIKETVGMKPCLAWPSLFCHTITKLAPDTQYVISIRARNIDTEDLGQAANILAVTREGVPGTPTNLRVTKVTNESLQIEWELPYIVNGILRSFLINVEHTDSANVTDCCEYFPVEELPVHEEAPFYTLQVSGLRPAAAYTVSVSAKSLTMGPAANVSYNTLPPNPIDMVPPEILSTEDGACSIKLISSEIPHGLNGTYLVMVLPNKDYSEPKIFDEELAQLLREAVNESFYIVAELSVAEWQNEKVLKIGTKASAINGKTAVLQDPELPREYKIGLALVFDYNGAKSVGFVSNV